jgi:hypothetical protein
MSLDVSKLENARERGGKIIARCPACAEADSDHKGEHLVVNEDGRFGCVIYPGDGPEAKEHRRRIFALCGDREIRRLAVHPSRTLRTPRTPVQESRAYFCKGAGLLKRLSRLFPAREPARDQKYMYDTSRSVLDVPRVPKTDSDTDDAGDAWDASQQVIHSTASSRRQLTEREISILREAGAKNDPIILDAINLFNATVVSCSQKPFTGAEPDPEIETSPDEVQAELNL